MKFEYIYVNEGDDVPQIVEKILNSKGKNFILFIPEGAEIAMSVVNFKLIAREAEAANKNIFINSEEETIIKMAEKAGIEVVEYKEKKKIERRGPSFIMDIAPPEGKKKKSKTESINLKSLDSARDKGEVPTLDIESQDVGEKSLKYTRSKMKKKPLNFIRGKKKRSRAGKFKLQNVVAIVVVVFLVLFIPYYLFAKAEITVISKKESQDLQSAILASISLESPNADTFKIPARYLNFSKEVTKEFQTTGFDDIEEKSRGIIRVYNNYSSKSQILIATTRFLSSEGKLFRLIDKIAVPGAKVESGKIIPTYVEAEVIADEVGEDFNIGPDKFSIPGFAGTVREGKFYGESVEPMSSGFIGEAKVASAEDLKKAKEELWEIAKVALEEEMNSKTEDVKILEDALVFEMDEAEFSTEADRRQDSFTGKLTASLRVLVFKEADIIDLFTASAIENKPSLEEKEFYDQELKYGTPRIDFAKGQMSFPVEVNLIFREKIDDSDFLSAAKGSRSSKLVEFFKTVEGVSGVKIRKKPSFLPFLPLKSKNIDLIID